MNTTFRFPILAVLAATLLGACSSGGSDGFNGGSATSPPAVAAIAAQDALRSGDIAKYASYFHPEALASFKNMTAPMFELAGKDSSTGNRMAGTFGDTFKDAEAVRQMSPEKFFTAVFGKLFENEPTMKTALAGAKIEALGYVGEGDVAHVVTRMQVEMMGTKITKTEVIDMKKDGDQWKMLLSGDLEGMANAMKAAAEAQGPGLK